MRPDLLRPAIRPGVVPLYGDLGAWAKANLKRGGYLACYAGHYHLPDVLDQLRRHLDYVWTFVVIHKGFYDAKVVHPHRILATWKPVLLFSNGKPAAPHPTMRDVFVSGRSKDHYPHEQPVEDAVFFVGCLSRSPATSWWTCAAARRPPGVPWSGWASGDTWVTTGTRRPSPLRGGRIAGEIKARKPFEPFEPMALGSLEEVL